jgi:hypothetical protein
MASRRSIKVRNTTEGVIDLGEYRNADTGEVARLVLGSTLDDGILGTPDRPVFQPKATFEAWAWDAAMVLRANQEHLNRGRIALGW